MLNHGSQQRCRIELYLRATFATLAFKLLTEMIIVLAVIMGQTQPKASPIKVTKGEYNISNCEVRILKIDRTFMTFLPCFMVVAAVNNNPPPPAAAADPEPPLDPKDFMVQNVEGQTILREPGTLSHTRASHII